MRKLIFTCIAATLVAAPMTTIVKAEELHNHQTGSGWRGRQDGH
jgi:hypothetical protein